MAIVKLSSNIAGYQNGDLSVYPAALDGFSNLYEVYNNSVTATKGATSIVADVLIVDNTDNFPAQGIVRLSLPGKKGTSVEFVYYQNKTRNTFYNLNRGFMGTKINSWPINTAVEGGVFADHHNSLKDAAINIETFVGVEGSTDETTVTGLLSTLENRYLAPIPAFRAYPLTGIPPLTVNFHCFTNSLINRFFWDFGDGSASYEKNPYHTYIKPGNYTVQLRIISDQGGQGVATKLSYISVADNYTTPFGYVTPITGKSIMTGGGSPTTFTFYDQTEGPIINRLWQFGDGTSYLSEDPNVMVVTHQYAKPGTYKPSVLITIEGNIVTRAIFSETVEVT